MPLPATPETHSTGSGFPGESSSAGRSGRLGWPVVAGPSGEGEPHAFTVRTRRFTTDRLASAAAKALGEALGLVPTVTGIEQCRLPLPDGAHYEWSVARCTISPGVSGFGESVIIKWLRDDPNGFRVDAAQLLTERAALEFLASAAPGQGPRLLATDAATTLLVLEDLQPRTSLYDLLDGPPSAAATVGLRAFARAMGGLGAATSGVGENYYLRRRELGPVEPIRDRLGDPGIDGGFEDRWLDTLATAETWGLKVPDRVSTDVEAAIVELAEPGPFLAFSNGDPGENNFLVSGEDGRIIDFEAAGFRHALLDAAALYVGHPRWVIFPDPARSGLETVYRTALAEGIPEAADERRFGYGISCAVLAAAIRAGSRRLIKLDRRSPGDLSRPQMITILEYAAATAVRFRCLTHLAGWCSALGELLRNRWPDADQLLRQLPDREAGWVRR